MIASSAICLSPQQESAVVAVEAWWRANDRASRPVFTLAGYAGTGKSTVVDSVIDRLGISRSRVAYVTPTWKAALVLQSKGLPAATIHSLIYHVEQDAFGRLSFHRRARLPDGYELIVVDEWSMVGRDIEEDLLAFGVPILVIGDPEQIPPVNIASSGRLERPDAFLAEIHRQAADNPILWASMLARKGESIPMGRHGNGELDVVEEDAIWGDEIDLSSFDQVICCTNKLRYYLNREIRKRRGFYGVLPQEGERVLSFRNVKDALSTRSGTPLVNGIQGTVTKAPWSVDLHDEIGLMSFALEGADDDRFDSISCDLARFKRPGASNYNPKSLPGNGRKAQLDFGYAITAHKSQGSEWPRVLAIVSDIFGDPDDRRRLLYTTITRASQHLTLAVREGQV